MDGLDAGQLVAHVIRPTLEYLGWQSPAAERLVLGTGITESRLKYLHQLGGGPALGIYQMEPSTFHDVWENFIIYHQPVYHLIDDLRDHRPTTEEEEVIYNLALATAVCRAQYRRQSEALPAADDARGLAEYHKRYYNSHLGATVVEISTAHFEQAIEICGGL